MNDNKKIVDKKIRELLTICTNNIKGYTKKEIIEQFLPVQVKNVEIYQEGAKIVVKKEKEEIADIWLDCGNYSNLEILTSITPLYGIECKNNNILELMKYRSKIILKLL